MVGHLLSMGATCFMTLWGQSSNSVPTLSRSEMTPGQSPHVSAPEASWTTNPLLPGAQPPSL